MIQWLYLLLKQVPTLMQFGSGNWLKNWASSWKIYALVATILLLILSVAYYTTLKKQSPADKQVKVLVQHAQKAEIASQEHLKNVKKIEDERIKRIYNIDVLMDDSVQIEIDKEFNFPPPRPPN